MVRTGLTLRDWEDGRIDHRSLLRFVRGLGPDSSFFAASRPDEKQTAAWMDGRAVCALLADLIDTVNGVGIALAYKGTGKTMPKLDRYPRPWMHPEKLRFGGGAIPISDFDDWYYGGGR